MNALTLTAKRVDGNPRISFDEAGSGPPLVFLHGIGGNSTNWREQQSAMADLCTTISWDARGYGRSEDYEGPLEFRLFGEDLARLLDARGIEKAHLVGLSMGARILLAALFLDWKSLLEEVTTPPVSSLSGGQAERRNLARVRFYLRARTPTVPERDMT